MRDGIVYLIHLSAPIGIAQNVPHKRAYKPQAQHYLGWTMNLSERFLQHQKGNGAKFLKRANELGVTFEVVRTWSGTRANERELKRKKNMRRYCPLCYGKSHEEAVN